jgi:hypothetical protein
MRERPSGGLTSERARVSVVNMCNKHKGGETLRSDEWEEPGMMIDGYPKRKDVLGEHSRQRWLEDMAAQDTARTLWGRAILFIQFCTLVAVAWIER